MDILTGLLLKKDFPNLNWNTFVEKSKATLQYNCIAFALSDTTRRWWPGMYGDYWPGLNAGVPQEATLDAFVALFATQGYAIRESESLEVGFEKIAIYANPSTFSPTHAAHQLPNGKWESKLGRGIDIQHDSLGDLAGPTYGAAVRFLKRPIEISEPRRQ